MDGLVIINGFLTGHKFSEPAEMLTEAADGRGVALRTLSNTDIVSFIGDRDSMTKVIGEPDFIIFWDKDVRLAYDLEICGYNVMNPSECIRICDDKALTHEKLAESGIQSIKTISSPMSFGQPYGDWVMKVKDIIGYPMVVKDCFGSFGEQVRLVRNDDELSAEGRSSVPKIFQEYIECGSQDLRLQVVGEEVVAAVRRKAVDGDFRANASHGGTMFPYSPTEEEIDIALDSAQALKADFLGVDILQTDNGPIICELNSNAHIRNITNATGIDVAGKIIDHALRMTR